MPSRETTPQLLQPLNLNRDDQPTIDLLSYRRLYGFDLLDCKHWQGYVQMPLFKLHVQVFTPNLENTRFDKIQERRFYYMDIWNIAEFISRSYVSCWNRALVS